MKHVKGTPWTLEKIKYFLVKHKSPYSPDYKEYKGQRFVHKWNCSRCGNKFDAHWKRIWKTLRGVHKGGCLTCANRLNYTIEQVHQELLDSKRPIKCLSSTYENNKKSMKWKCTDCSHEWQTTWKNIKGTKGMSAQGCIVCAKNVKYTVERIREILIEEERPIKLISTVYENNTTPIQWECLNNNCHGKWKATWASVNCSGHGCPFCATLGQTEKKIGVFLNKVFGKKTFIKVRPDFLKNPKTNKNLEIDLYSEKLNLAIEINGVHHYEYSDYFHRSIENFLKVQSRDKFKESTLKKLNVNFISVCINKVSLKKVKEFIKQELEKLGYKIPKKFNELKIT